MYSEQAKESDPFLLTSYLLLSTGMNFQNTYIWKYGINLSSYAWNLHALKNHTVRFNINTGVVVIQSLGKAIQRFSATSQAL